MGAAISCTANAGAERTTAMHRAAHMSRSKYVKMFHRCSLMLIKM